MEGKIFGLEAWKTEQQNPTNFRPGPSQDGREREQPQGKYRAARAKPDRIQWARIRGNEISHITGLRSNTLLINTISNLTMKN